MSCLSPKQVSCEESNMEPSESYEVVEKTQCLPIHNPQETTEGRFLKSKCLMPDERHLHDESNMEPSESYEVVEKTQCLPIHNHNPQETTEGLLEKLKCLVPDERHLHDGLQKVAEDYRQKNLPVINLNELIKAITTTVERIKPQETKGLGSRLFSYTPSLTLSLSSSKKAKVYIVVAAKTFGADQEILKGIHVEICPEPANCDVVLVFCPVTSRSGSDMEDAMRNISEKANGKKMILVVMHHSIEDIYLPQPLQNPGYPNVIKYVNVVYHESKKGLIKCDRNDKAIQELKEFCKNLAS
ncbi:uncharacterized protein LOC117379987 [Periophthalmus magnuspinnatus]|uniref:uncharacterized protein LOC117379987 n=1 Tax=Periophthalmus magnuspinnatus TaxID=409849 RepID=UPI00145B29F2|nr:uncharacterized protein LOC117379987 [Periophthalmus magnuspinnatus]